MGKPVLGIAVIMVGGLWLFARSNDLANGPAYAFPGGGPGFGLLPVTDATPSCAGCHSNAKPNYMRDVPPDFPLNATNQLIENKHYGALEKGEGAYAVLSAADRTALLRKVKLVDQNSTVSISAPTRVKKGEEVKVEVRAKGGIGPGSGVMLVDTDLRMQARPVQGNGWFIVGAPEIIGPDGKPQTFWVDKRFGDLPKNVNFVVVGGGADIDKGSYPAWTVTYRLRAPADPGKYTLAAAFLYGTEEANEHRVEGQWTLPSGGVTGPSGRVLYSEVLAVEVE